MSSPTPKPKTYCFDIDGVIATLTPNNQYDLAQPIAKTVALIKRLFETGNYIILFTARGYVTGIDWEPLTRQQMHEWGVPYHELKFGKPAADYYIDDKLIGVDELVEQVSHESADTI